MSPNSNTLILYNDSDGKVNVNVRFAEEDVWLTQNQLAEVYCTTQQNIAQHIANIYNDLELDEATHKKFLLVRQEGNREVQRSIDHYNLDMMIESLDNQIIANKMKVQEGKGSVPHEETIKKPNKNARFIESAKWNSLKVTSTKLSSNCQ